MPSYTTQSLHTALFLNNFLSPMNATNVTDVRSRESIIILCKLPTAVTQIKRGAYQAWHKDS